MKHWKNKIVVVTGGSEGLGREIAFNFAGHGAKVVILARNEARLKQVSSDAKSEELAVDWLVADVTDDQSVDDSICEIIRRHGAIDVWVNNVGKSTRTSLMDCGVAQYRELMDVNFYSAVRCSLAALPHLKETSGHLVNIGSLASKTGWPYVAPYATSKHALAAFNHQLRLEGPSTVHYLLVCSGPIQRPDALTRYAGQAAGLGDLAAKPGGGVKLSGISAANLAQKIERSCRRRKRELIVPGYTRFLFALAQISPWLGDLVLRRSGGN